MATSEKTNTQTQELPTTVAPLPNIGLLPTPTVATSAILERLPTTVEPLESVITAGDLKSNENPVAFFDTTYEELPNYKPSKLGQEIVVEKGDEAINYVAAQDSETKEIYWVHFDDYGREGYVATSKVKYNGKMDQATPPEKAEDKMGAETKEDNTITKAETKDKDATSNQNLDDIEEAVPAASVGDNIPTLSSKNISSDSSYSPSILSSETPGTYNGITSGEFEGEDLFKTVAKLSNFNSIESINFSDGMQRKIDCFLVSKTNINQKNTFHFTYGKDIKSISITQSVSSYGIFATIDIHDVAGYISTLANYCLNYYFVVSIFNVVDESNGQINGYMTQPYIFEIDSAIPISPDGNVSKVYRFKLKDIVSSTLEKVAVGNLLLEYPSLTNVANFGELYTIILNYAGLIINYIHDKKYCIDCKIYFLDDNNDQYNEIVRGVIFQDIKLTMDCYSFLNYVYQHAAKELAAPVQFTGENPGNILVPLFLQDEIADIRNEYSSFFKRTSPEKIVNNITFGKGKYDITATYISRNFYAKNLLMPFELAFTSTHPSKKSVIYESLNPLRNINGSVVEAEEKYLPMNGYVFTPIEDSVDMPPRGSEIGLGWKNLVLFHDSPGSSGNILIFFNWIYDYYHEVFLNKDNSYLVTQMGKYLTPAIDPHFHVMERAGLMGGDEVAFAKMNSNTITLKTSEPIKEALYYAGRSIKSYIMMNSLHGFKIKGDLLRHPGEIIKISSPVKNADEESPVAIIGGISTMGNLHNLIYTNTVTHIFDGNTFKDLIYANKICNIDVESYQKYQQDDNSGSVEEVKEVQEITASAAADGKDPDQNWEKLTGEEALYDPYPGAKPDLPRPGERPFDNPDDYSDEDVLKFGSDENVITEEIPNNIISSTDETDNDLPPWFFDNTEDEMPPWLIDDVNENQTQ